jgi:hypothetical protein
MSFDTVDVRSLSPRAESGLTQIIPRALKNVLVRWFSRVVSVSFRLGVQGPMP